MAAKENGHREDARGRDKSWRAADSTVPNAVPVSGMATLRFYENEDAESISKRIISACVSDVAVIVLCPFKNQLVPKEFGLLRKAHVERGVRLHVDCEHPKTRTTWMNGLKYGSTAPRPQDEDWRGIE